MRSADYRGEKNPCKPSAEAIKKCGQIIESGSYDQKITQRSCYDL